MTNIVSLASGVPYDDIELIELGFREFNDVIDRMSRSLEKKIFLVGFDRNHEFDLKIDQWLDSQTTKYPVLLYRENILESKLQFKNIQCVLFNSNTMANIEMLMFHRCAFDFQLSAGKWLCLGRRPTNFRNYIAQNWTNQLKEHITCSINKDKFIGKNFNFYDQPPYHASILNTNNLLSLQDTFNQTCGSIVIESNGGATLTEKTFQALFAKHPFLAVAPQGSVSYLRNHGFDMFDDIFDHSYDSITNLYQRIDHLFKSNLNILQTGIDRRNFSKRLDYNHQHVTTYWNKIMKELWAELQH